MARAGAALRHEADLLVPVPLHRRRLYARRYNQAALLARACGKLAGRPVLVDALAGALVSAGPGAVVVVDDAEYADPASLRVLASALEAAGGASVMLVLTLGSPAQGPSAELCS